ncbi:MAG: MarR family transcriptional regulator [Limosilactobacillus sp.]|uniref:MarR family winged helix-turn-helix transcriptional regulator n=1 Tax=Limosilactobacillus sp. TaxID=2773925 RepID=UPI0026FA2B98|nr:MarR family transcriptional regulator [Limosilactobacillus sp.]
MNTEEKFFQQAMAFGSELRNFAAECVDKDKVSFRGQGMLLHILATNPNVSQRELSNLAKIKPASISESLDRMEKSEIVVRGRDESDRRVLRVNLTEKGQELYKKQLKGRREFQDKLLTNVSEEEQQTVINVIQKMREQLAEMKKGEKHFD